MSGVLHYGTESITLTERADPKELAVAIANTIKRGGGWVEVDSKVPKTIYVSAGQYIWIGGHVAPPLGRLL